MNLIDYFDRVAIIHLPERTDRYVALCKELSKIGIGIGDEKLVFPSPPIPTTANGFHSRGVYGNFLSHLGIIEDAYNDGLQSVWILEDDAMFSNEFRSSQKLIARHLSESEWDEVFIGHSATAPRSPSGLARVSGDFIWAHCYAVHRRIMPRMIDYFRSTLEREPGHEDGAKMYIDAAHCHFRRRNPDVVCLISSPCMSVQAGSMTSLGAVAWHESSNWPIRWMISRARALRDDMWRWGMVNIKPKGDSDLTSIDTISFWP
jgi:glycosyl transferase, family 25